MTATGMDTLGGQVTWGTSDKKLNPVPNVCTTPVAGGQWVKGTKYPYDLVVVNNSQATEGPDPGRAAAASSTKAARAHVSS